MRRNAHEPAPVSEPAESHARRAAFATLLDNYRALILKDERPNKKGTATWLPLLIRFTELQARQLPEVDAIKPARAADFNALLRSFQQCRNSYLESQKSLASDFNILGVFQLTQKEIRHSMVLAWLLDHDLDNYGTHAQGPLGFRLFLSEFGLPSAYAESHYWVRREVSGDDSIVDIEIAARGHFLVHIENKIWSLEGLDQTEREWNDLERRALSLGLDPQEPQVHAFYLTPYGVKAANPRFVSISWKRMTNVLERFAEEAKPTDVRLFASHYARVMKTFIVRERDDQGTL